MFSGIRRLLGSVKVTQNEKEIVISGLPADVIQRDISKIWKTSRINTNMFTVADKSHLSFPLFFAPDVYYMLDAMTAQRSLGVNVRTLTKIKDLLMADTWLRNTQLEHTPRVDLKRLANMTKVPLDYQQGFLETYDRLTQQYGLRGYLLSAAAGSGKTFTTLALSECLGAERIVVVCPKNAIERVWQSGVLSDFKVPQPYWIAAHKKPYQNERIAIFHYESLDTALKLVEELKTTTTTVILDESHNLNEITSLRTQLFLELVQKLECRDVIWASGTPIKALGAESIPLLRSIDPYFTEDVQARFKKIYGQDGNRGIDILRHRMGLISYKVEKHQLNLDKPLMKKLPVVIPNGKDYTLSAIRKDMQDFIDARFKYYASRKKDDHAFYNRCLDLHERQLKGGDKALFQQYKADVKEVQAWGGDARYCGEAIKRTNHYEKTKIIPSLPQVDRNQFKEVKSIVKYLNLKIQGEALGRVLGRKRIQCHVDMVPYIDFKGVCESTAKKTVVFTSFVEVLEASKIHLEKNGMNPVIVYGKTNNDLANSIKLFEQQEDLNPLIATYQSLSTAVPLVMADTMIMVNSPFRAYIHEQAISRIHRLGADTQTVVYEAYLDTGKEPNISTRSNDILAWSQAQVAAIMGIENPFQYEVNGDELVLSAETYDLETRISAREILAELAQESVFMKW